MSDKLKDADEKIREVLELIPEPIHVFILLLDEETGEMSNHGLGCPACMVDEIRILSIKGQFKHNNPMKDVVKKDDVRH